jgi:ABC-type phosphate transport system permease subunit
MVFVTHDIAEAFALATRVALLKDGEMILARSSRKSCSAPTIPKRAPLPPVFTIGEAREPRRDLAGVSGRATAANSAGLIVEHLFLVVMSTGIAVLIGVPLGVLLTRKPALSKPVLGFANIMQTVPSLALFGFLIPLNIYIFHMKILGGIGARTAIVALALYALLPIIRNTFAGISSVDPAIRDAGRGMGMTDRQLLFQVELPLALGVIIAGVRVAT